MQSFTGYFNGTVNSRFKKDLNLQIHLHKAFFSDDRFLDSYHKSFLNQTTLDLRKEKWSFLNREFTVLIYAQVHTSTEFQLFDSIVCNDSTLHETESLILKSTT